MLFCKARPRATIQAMKPRLLAAGALLSVLGACGPKPPPPAVFEMPTAPQRKVCGWQEIGPGAEVLSVPAQGSVPTAAAGQQIVSLRAEDATSFGRIRRALDPAADTLVRVKVVLEGRWLLPTTFPRRQPAEPPPPARSVETKVGQHTVRRDRAAPVDRLAEVKLEGERLTLFLEGADPEGRDLTLAQLGPLLKGSKPPPLAFVLTATDDTPWRQVRTALQAVACYDRRPGQEPHDVILRAEPARLWAP